MHYQEEKDKMSIILCLSPVHRRLALCIYKRLKASRTEDDTEEHSHVREIKDERTPTDNDVIKRNFGAKEHI
jgi:hypothetical protein